MVIDPTRYRHVRFTRQGRILTAALNREQALNAVDAALHEELSRLFTDLEEDEDSDVLVLTGTGRAFCAGGDLPWLQSAIDDPAVVLDRRDEVVDVLDIGHDVLPEVTGTPRGSYRLPDYRTSSRSKAPSMRSKRRRMKWRLSGWVTI